MSKKLHVGDTTNFSELSTSNCWIFELVGGTGTLYMKKDDKRAYRMTGESGVGYQSHELVEIDEFQSVKITDTLTGEESSLCPRDPRSV